MFFPAGDLASRTVTRSRTACDVRETPGAEFPGAAPQQQATTPPQQQQQQPLPAPRRRSSDNNLVAMMTGGTTASETAMQLDTSDQDSAPAPMARPRPVPRRDVQSYAPSSASDTATESPPLLRKPPPAVSRRPGSVQVLPSPSPPPDTPAAGSSRPAPPPPVAARPAPVPPGNSAPVPPARNARAATKPAPGEDQTHLLDRTNSLINDPPLSSAPDPFDTAFAKAPPVPFNTLSNPDPFSSAFSPKTSVDPFSVSISSGPPTSPDPFDTSFVTKPALPAPVSSAELNDPFDTSNINRGPQVPLSSQNSAGFETKPFDGNGIPPNSHWDPFSLSSPNIASPQPQIDCPAEAPPPLPRNPSPVIGPPAPSGPPPVPSRGNVAPPPVPKRPS